MANLLDADFGSESEGENFNPAPAVGSDDEDLAESDNEVTVRQKTNGANSSHNITRSDIEDDSAGRPGVGRSTEHTRGAGSRAAGEEPEDDEDEDGVPDESNEHTNGADEEDEDEDEDDEDEEDAVKVNLTIFLLGSILTITRGGHGNAHVEISGTNSSSSKPK